MSKFDLSVEKNNEYTLKCKEQIKRELEIKTAIERRGELYTGELKIVLENLKTWNEMLELLKNNR